MTKWLVLFWIYDGKSYRKEFDIEYFHDAIIENRLVDVFRPNTVMFFQVHQENILQLDYDEPTED